LIGTPVPGFDEATVSVNVGLGPNTAVIVWFTSIVTLVEDEDEKSAPSLCHFRKIRSPGAVLGAISVTVVDWL
jgi:hypothetical protein